MKKIVYLILLFPILVIGQNTSENYIRSKTYKTETATPIASPTVSQANQSITYFDGLGRPIQQIAHQQSASGNSIVTPIEYDAFGRQVKEYLPYVTNSASLNFVSTALTDVGTFYNTTLYENTLNPYSLKELEASPLNRVLKQAAPGDAWSMTNNHVIHFDYQTNTATDAVKLFTVTATWNTTKGLYDIPASLTAGSYADFQLYKTITKDENWKTTDGTNNTTEEFKDKQGKVVLKRTYNNGAKHDTYYVYDQYGNLTYVMPPLVNATATISNTTLEGLCYQYKYDHRNRLVEKKLPGKQWEFIVYDKLDRVVATGPALSPFTSPSGNGWMITKYDVFNRVVYTGWSPLATIDSNTRKNFQAQYNAETTNFSETKTATTSNTTIGGVALRYSNVAIPTTGYHILTVNYYDDYNFPNAPTSIPTIIEGQTVFYNATVKPKGLPTGSYVRVPETSTLHKAETSYTLYDSKARQIRNYSLNYLGGFTQVDTNLDFIGKTQYTITTHSRSTATPVIKVKDAFTYTPQDRLLTHTHQIDGGTIQLLTKNEYDELGQLITKRVGGTDVTGTTYLQKVDYTYNIRGWLKGINDTNNLSVASDPQDLFAFKINYNIVENETDYTGTKLYNGNISETYWRTARDNKLRKYGYKYDNLNRLSDAIYQKPEEAVVVTNSFNESLYYDKNGNIIKLLRKGEYDDYIYNIQIDNLEYVYHTDKPNQLMKVTDLEANPSGFKDGNTVNDDYDYDDNGNMIFDKNKNISRISYDHLNLPKTISFGTLGTIEYLYDANGQKLKKVVTEGTTITTTDYLSSFQYKNSVLQFFPTAEGYANATPGKYGTSLFNYVYNYNDHLGNVRVSYSKDNTTGEVKIFEENHYYPFGLKHKDYNALALIWSREGNEEQARIRPTTPFMTSTFKYKYNGKEFQDELGLNAYDFGARMYMPDIVRWPSIDPQAELLERSSPYVYALNSPLIYVDNDGELPIFINGKTTSDSERADVSYWTASIINTVKGSGIANPGGEVHYVDGNRGHSWSGKAGGYATQYDNVNAPSRRAQGGRYAAEDDWKTILSKLARDPKTGKIIEKIQIYTHSRGAAFGVGYTEKLLELIKENSSQFADANNVIDFVYNMAPHQSDSLTAPDGVNSYSHDHTNDWLSGNDMKGIKGAFTSDEGDGGIVPEAHYITGFQNDLKAFTSSFLKGGSSQDVINNFIKTMKDKYGVTVTVQE